MDCWEGLLKRLETMLNTTYMYLWKGFILHSKDAHFEKFAAAHSAAKLIFAFPVPFYGTAWPLATLQICFLHLCLAQIICTEDANNLFSFHACHFNTCRRMWSHSLTNDELDSPAIALSWLLFPPEVGVNRHGPFITSLIIISKLCNRDRVELPQLWYLLATFPFL